MSLPLPEDFHVETKKATKCKNPTCTRTIGSEMNFCPSCWGHLRAGTRDRIMRAQASRNKPGIAISVRRAVTELKVRTLAQLKAKDAKRQANTQGKKVNAAFSNNPTMPSLAQRPRSDAGRQDSHSHRPGHDATASRPSGAGPERGVGK